MHIKDRIYDSVYKWQDTGQRKPVLWHILPSDSFYCLYQDQENKLTPNITALPSNSDLTDE